jgi:hypothetical protein
MTIAPQWNADYIRAETRATRFIGDTLRERDEHASLAGR